MGNMKTKELPALAAPTIASVFKEHLEQMRETLSQTTPNSQPNLESAWSKVLKPYSSSQKSLEVLNKEIKRVLKVTVGDELENGNSQ